MFLAEHLPLGILVLWASSSPLFLNWKIPYLIIFQGAPLSTAEVTGAAQEGGAVESGLGGSRDVLLVVVGMYELCTTSVRGSVCPWWPQRTEEKGTHC